MLQLCRSLHLQVSHPVRKIPSPPTPQTVVYRTGSPLADPTLPSHLCMTFFISETPSFSPGTVIRFFGLCFHSPLTVSSTESTPSNSFLQVPLETKGRRGFLEEGPALVPDWFCFMKMKNPSLHSLRGPNGTILIGCE